MQAGGLHLCAERRRLVAAGTLEARIKELVQIEDDAFLRKTPVLLTERMHR